ncbi:hypothetical protein [Bacillus sp. 1P06AnD]|uniref:hypothetical protein n=1 Tax=Bacillus sp. 1P06AnD TaxID=3132208 RepID=UPI0039A0B851
MITIILISIAIILFLLSFFVPDRFKQLEKNVEELSLQHVQDIYQLKKKMRILEEELMAPEALGYGNKMVDTSPKINEILKSQVLALYAQGHSIEEISSRSTLSHKEIENILLMAEMEER